MTTRAAQTFAIRLVCAIVGSAIFGLIATSSAQGIALASAVLTGFAFGTAFVGGTGYRILIAFAQNMAEQSPTSWSGAAAASAILTLASLLFWAALGFEPGRLILGYAIAINFAYAGVKLACLRAGCCQAEVSAFGRKLDLRKLECTLTVLVLVCALLVAVFDVWAGALAGLAGHTSLRLFSRAKRNRFSTGWPPLRQPGAELFPLYGLTLIALAGTLA
jgi:hypothetical protein